MRRGEIERSGVDCIDYYLAYTTSTTTTKPTSSTPMQYHRRRHDIIDDNEANVNDDNKADINDDKSKRRKTFKRRFFVAEKFRVF